MTKISILTLNARGLASKRGFNDFISTCKMWKRLHALGVVCVQEHNLPRNKEAQLTKTAKARGYTLIITFGGADDDTSERKGVLMMICDEVAEIKKTHYAIPGFIRAEVQWGTKTIDVGCVYAPAQPLQRVDFFNSLRGKLDNTTHVGGDWNCVPDVTLDVDSANPLAYANRGATLLGDIVGNLALNDIRREQLGNAPEYTRKGPNPNGTWTSSRIDRWYTPTRDDLLYTVEVLNTFVFKKQSSDHSAVLLKIESQQGKLGHDRISLRNDLMEEEEIQLKVLEAYKSAWRTQGAPEKKWRAGNNKAYEILLNETRRRQKIEHKEIKYKLAILDVFSKRHARSGATEASAKAERRLQDELYELRHPEKPPAPTQKEAIRMTEMSDNSTRAMFAPYKSRAKQQWINEIKTAVWKDGERPQYTGSTTDPAMVGSSFVDLFKTIYGEKVIDENEAGRLLRRLKRSKITKASQEMMSALVTTNEVKQVMIQLPTMKAAGPNRIPNEVYKYLAGPLAPMLTEVINKALEKGQLPAHFLEGDISMLYKKDDRTDPTNYRPITLLNTDYKIFTRVLAHRMKQVVHEFVSDCQKGFVPDVFIAEATAMLRMVEAYINEEPEEREGIFLFLDMEKAFDRVSYDFTMKGLQKLGMGDNFCKWVGMMYNTEKAPKRRMYVNGYYSEWFDIKSGVAQGCPLSPLLFLIVAEALKISFDMEKKLKGIDVMGKKYKLSQFADDTAVLLRRVREIKYANRALKRWCDATGMRENVKKREGLAMGALRHQNIGRGIKWAPEKGWCRCLGVPIGNELDETRWWSEKVNAVRIKASYWVGLTKSGYYGRNLITQGMYLGRLRYWLYSLGMNKHMRDIVQKDADILWWSREPKLEPASNNGIAEKNLKRIRRWVARCTATGPRTRGGLGNMDWGEHVKAIQAQWMIRYLQPGDAAWKRILDSWILGDNKLRTKYPEGRVAILLKLTNQQRLAMLRSIPSGARYWKECLMEFWKLNLTPTTTGLENIGAESPWHGYRSRLSPPDYHTMLYCKNILNIHQISDFIDSSTNHRFSKEDWKDFVEELEEIKKKRKPSNTTILTRADQVFKLAASISRDVCRAARATYYFDIETGMRIYLQKDDGTCIPAVIIDDQTASRVSIDNVGKEHVTTEVLQLDDYLAREAVMWGDRWAGPKGQLIAFPAQTKFTLLGKEEVDLCDLVRSQDGLAGISLITRLKARIKMKKPACEEVWSAKQSGIKWPATWNIRPEYLTPRDQITWLKLMHRNLWVAGTGGMDTQECAAAGCRCKESQMHLVECTVYKTEFWSKVGSLMGRLGLDSSTDQLKWIAGIKPNGKPVTKEEASVIFLAWRTLYAETTSAHIEGHSTKTELAFKRLVRILHTRVEAFGAKWRRWYLRQQCGIGKVVPRDKREKKLMTCASDATYEINNELVKALRETGTNRRARRRR